MKQRVFYTEWCYLLGIICLAVGVALMEAADFGLSMVVAPAYLLHLKLQPVFSFFSFGMAEYTLQAVLLVLMCLILRRFRVSYLFSFVTAVFYGFVLDGVIALAAFLPQETLQARFVLYILGMVICSAGVALVFHTYIPPEAYELFVKELSEKWNIPNHRFKTVYDLTSCAVAVLMSFLFFGFGHFEGVRLGTVACALINGWLIGLISKWMEKNFVFRDALSLRRFFEAK